MAGEPGRSCDERFLRPSGNPTSVLDLTYSYGTTNNNGNILSSDCSFVVGGYTQTLYTQSFSYDALNRLATATETAGGNTSWTQSDANTAEANQCK